MHQQPVGMLRMASRVCTGAKRLARAPLVRSDPCSKVHVSTSEVAPQQLES